MKIVIMGAGAIGSLYGGMLGLAGGSEVILVGRRPHVEAIRRGGLKFKGVLGDRAVRLKAIDDPRQITQADFVFITTKTYDTLTAASRVRHLADSGAYIVVLQNGLGTEKEVENALSTTRVLRATTCMGALVTRPGEITVTGQGLTEIGSHHVENVDAVEQVAELLRHAGFEVKTSDNIDGVVWTKTIVNCGVNPVGALTGLTNGEVYSNKALRGLVLRLVKEAAKVADGLGVKLTTDDPVRYTLGTAKATGANVNSMLQDIRARKKTEIDSITGEVIRLAHELGIETPASEAVCALVKALELQYLRSTGSRGAAESTSFDEVTEATTSS
ncbi:MAG: 2-dehydropantoate 2-reductase [Candidatus Thorarchaeota archaeon]|nr:MAG: 2-dehydropantoate 2-reductase [Candidatus Thorarchaeota archaeon]